MKVSDYIISYLESYGVKDVFLLSGGGMMHLLDSLAQNNNINKYYNLHEQAAAFCADAYAQTAQKLGVCFVTSGPGGTNAITGVASAHIDSTPLLVVSGQVRTNTMIGDKKVRQYGAQEIDIVSMVQSTTKYAVTIMKANEVRYHLGKAIYLATHGRPGAVWLDIPLDVQGAQIEPASLKAFDAEVDHRESGSSVSDDDVTAVFDMLAAAQRPVLLVGSGVIQARAGRELLQFSRQTGIPVLSSRRAKGLFTEDTGVNYYSCPAAIAPRYANYILQNSDALLSIGCGLRYTITSHNERGFAPRAKKIINNIDGYEIQKLDMDIERSIVCDAKKLIDLLLAGLSSRKLPNWPEWVAYCDKMRDKYPQLKEAIISPRAVNGYLLADSLFRHSSAGDVILPSQSTYMGDYPFIFNNLAAGQSLVVPIGLGAMGSGLPNAIGACIASGKKRTVLFEGDGSLQHNVQELALLKTYHLPIKLFIENNNGYLEIKNMQNRHFNGRLAGCNPESGVNLPCLRGLAAAYELQYEVIEDNSQLDDKISKVMMDNAPVLCEVIGSEDTQPVPILQSRILPDGKMATASMEDMYPFLPEREHAENMSISK